MARSITPEVSGCCCASGGTEVPDDAGIVVGAACSCCGRRGASVGSCCGAPPDGGGVVVVGCCCGATPVSAGGATACVPRAVRVVVLPEPVDVASGAAVLKFVELPPCAGATPPREPDVVLPEAEDPDGPNEKESMRIKLVEVDVSARTSEAAIHKPDTQTTPRIIMKNGAFIKLFFVFIFRFFALSSTATADFYVLIIAFFR